MQAYNVAAGASRATIAALAEWIAEAAGVPLVREKPESANAGTPIPRQVLSSEKLEALGWRARFSLQEGIGRTLTALREAGKP